MFKPGEVAGVREDKRTVTIKASLPKGRVDTSEGVFKEADLFVAHPSVLKTASGRGYVEPPRFGTPKFSIDDIRLSSTQCLKVKEVLKAAKFDWNGHWKSGGDLDQEVLSSILDNIYITSLALSREHADAFIQAASGGPLAEWTNIDHIHLRGDLRTCNNCGGEDFSFEFNGKTIRITGEPCEFPNGLPPNEWELNVPSGKLVVANDLRALFPLPEPEEPNINTRQGCRQVAQAYAENGMSHAFVGNSCPSVFRCKDGTYKIANEPSDTKWDEATKTCVEADEVEFDGKDLANICTDLWWYSICDHEEFKRRCKRFKHKAKDFRTETVAVEPGVYRFRHNDNIDRDGPGETIFTTFERVRDPDPVKDFIALYDNADVNPFAYVQSKVAKWPTLYGRGPWERMTEEARMTAWSRVADHLFCTIGGGNEWHDRGFPRARVDSTVPDVDPPSFRAQFYWYPFSKPYGGLFAQTVLTPSFAKLAFRVMESVISFGTQVSERSAAEIRSIRNRMQLAVERYRQLAAQYPEAADPEYVAWLKEKGRAEAWVKGFDLGPNQLVEKA